MNAIIYTSNTGNTRQYAEMLSEKINIPVYSLADAPSVESGSVIYMGWVMASTISGLSEAMQKYDIKAVCAVGMAPEETEKMINDLAEKNNTTVPVFYLPGGFSIKKLSGMYKLMMNMMSKKIKSEISAKSEKNKADELMLQMFTEGISFVNEEHLQKILDWISSDNQ